MSLLNLVVALTNITCFYPIYISLFNEDYLTMCCIIFVSFFSFISHLFENYKHGMTGLTFFNKFLDNKNFRKNIYNKKKLSKKYCDEIIFEEKYFGEKIKNNRKYNKFERILIKFTDYKLLNTNSKKFSYLLNRFDVLGCILCIFRFVFIIDYDSLALYEIFFIIPIFFNIYSEYDKYNIKRKTIYVMFHSFWHFNVFIVMGLILLINVY